MVFVACRDFSEKQRLFSLFSAHLHHLDFCLFEGARRTAWGAVIQAQNQGLLYGGNGRWRRFVSRLGICEKTTWFGNWSTVSWSSL